MNLKIIVLCHSELTFDKSKPCYKREWYISPISTASSTNPKKEMEIKSHHLPSLLWRCGFSANCFSLSQSFVSVLSETESFFLLILIYMNTINIILKKKKKKSFLEDRIIFIQVVFRKYICVIITSTILYITCFSGNDQSRDFLHFPLFCLCFLILFYCCCFSTCTLHRVCAECTMLS